jgi:hypothetical protein
VGAPQEIPLRGKTSFFFRARRREKYFPPRGKASLKDFALPERVTLLRALRALRASFVISVRALGRGESAQYKYLNRADYIFTYRFPSLVGCVSPLLHPMAQRRPPCRTEPRSEARSGQLAQWRVLLRSGPLPVGSCGDNPQGGSPHREARTGKAHPGKPSQGNPHLGGPHGASRTLCRGN